MLTVYDLVDLVSLKKGNLICWTRSDSYYDLRATLYLVISSELSRPNDKWKVTLFDITNSEEIDYFGNENISLIRCKKIC